MNLKKRLRICAYVPLQTRVMCKRKEDNQNLTTEQDRTIRTARLPGSGNLHCWAGEDLSDLPNSYCPTLWKVLNCLRTGLLGVPEAETYLW